MGKVIQLKNCCLCGRLHGKSGCKVHQPITDRWAKKIAAEMATIKFDDPIIA